MTKERIPISGDLKSKVKQLMEYAGWREGRKVDSSIAEQYYADHGVPMMNKSLGIILTVCSKNDHENAIAGLNCAKFFPKSSRLRTLR